MPATRNLAELEDALSEPTAAAINALAASPGDIVVLGAGGKMGPSLARMARRAADSAGGLRRVIAVSRFSSAATADDLRGAGVEAVSADLSSREAWDRLPDAANVIYMVGQKFGTQDAPGRTWFTNTVLPAFAAHQYRNSRIVAFSTGNVYPLTLPADGGSKESDAPAPIGEYAQSCLGRERVFEYAATTWGTRIAILRLNYAVDLRYGVLVDLALKVQAGLPVDLAMGHVNCIWQGDANAAALASLTAATTPATVLNLTGTQTLSVREVALRLGEAFGRAPIFRGGEGAVALLSDASRTAARLGPWRVDEQTLIEWVAAWVKAGNSVSGKPTHFEETEGRF